MVEKAEVAIVGGGIIGASIAYHLAARGVTDVVVFEREETLGTGATGKCAGGVRLQFSTEANIAMSRLSIEALARFDEELGERVDFRQNGYLFVLTTEADVLTFRANAERQRALGVPVEVITPEAALEIVPQLHVGDVLAATYCAEDGIANPHAIVQGYAKTARRLGARFLLESEVTGVATSSSRVESVTVNGSERWEVGTLVNAAGPWARKIGELAGADVPVSPVRRQYFITAPLEWISDSFPLLIDWGTGVYMHKESGGMLVGESDPNQPPGFDQSVDWDFLATVSEHAIARVPPLEDAQIQTGVAGLYEVSPDHNAILGHVPGLENFVLANGFSGHGMQHAPAVGLAISELIVDGESRTVDLTPFAIERLQSESIAEHNVI
jgi:sarcosine oxidase subunit beta